MGKPTKPKGLNRATSATRGRLPGFSPSYTPEQTARYKSQALRYSKAVELSAAGPDHIEWNGQILSGDDAANLRDAGGRAFKLTDRVGFYYQSQRSKLDYWTVRYGGGGLDDLELFTDAITTTGTATCTVPTVVWSWENPEFNWSAETIHVCNEDEPPQPPGQSSYTLPRYSPGNYNPVPSGQSRFVTFTSTAIVTNSTPSNTFTQPPYVVSFSRYMNDADVLTNESFSGDYAGPNNMPGIYGYVRVFLNGFSINNGSQTGFNFASRDGDYFNQVYITTVQLSSADGPLNPPPTGTPPPFPLSPSTPGVAPPFPPYTTKATAGGTFTSNIFTASSATVKATLGYTTVSDIGAITGAIAVQLWSDADVKLDELAETPSNGGAGQLEATFNLEADQAYYVVIVIPETCYCDAATVAIGGAGFECDCPDYTKAQTPMFNSVYNSEQVDRNWTSSAAGCDTEQGCKHVIGTKIFLGIPYDVPTDYPL